MEKLSGNQMLINGLREEAESPDDHAYIDELQKEHNENRMSAGMPTEGPEGVDPRLQTPRTYSVDERGLVQTNSEPPSPDDNIYPGGHR